MKDVADKLSTSLGRKDQEPNKKLAESIIRGQDTEAIDALIEVIQKPASVDLLGDALKVLEEIGMVDSELAKPAFPAIMPLLDHNQNKIQWRVMSALSPIAAHYPVELYHKLGNILKIMDQGSVITRDHGFKILVTLYQIPTYQETLKQLILEQIGTAPDNQLGQYAEKWFDVINYADLPSLQKSLESRQAELTSASHLKRITKLLKRIHHQTAK